jgi:hypothetical protein
MSIVKALKERGLIDIGAVPVEKGSADFAGFLYDFFDHDKSAYVKDRLADGHSIMIPADIGKDFERYSGKAGKRGVLTVEEAAALFARPWRTGLPWRVIWYPRLRACGRGRFRQSGGLTSARRFCTSTIPGVSRTS